MLTETRYRGARTSFVFCGALLLALLSACGTSLPENQTRGRHLTQDAADPAGAEARENIPDIVDTPPPVSAPQAGEEPELFTVVAQDVPLHDMLFTLSRDAGINVDIHPGIDGPITLNAIDQTLPQILQRIARQTDIRWYFDEADNLVVEPDSPYWQTYRVDYVNVSRSGQTQATTSTSLVTSVGGATGGGGGGAAGGTNNSVSTITQNFSNNFWTTLPQNLAALLGESAEDSEAIVSNPESGVISVRATSRQQRQVAEFIDTVTARSQLQVLIEATIVEVDLNDDFQSGVDWSLVDRNNGEINFTQDVALTGNNAVPTNVLTIDRLNTPDAITATVSLLSQFGELRVLSSPKIMALNNQTAMLRVVDNTVYFTVDVEPGVVANGVGSEAVYTTTVNTVPVGFVMSVTPQIGEDEQVTLNIRPTISRIKDTVIDPNPVLRDSNIENPIPQIQVQEFESVLKLSNGQVGILGGLMQDSLRTDIEGMPGLSRLPVVRNLFSRRAEFATKSELIIFIRPVVVREPSLNGDLMEYQPYLPTGELKSSALSRPGNLPGIR